MATGRIPTTANSPLTTKGDLFGYSTTQARVAVGSDGDTLVADSAASTGLRYQSAYNGNGIINGGMDIWQRGTSFALTTPSTAYTADRWLGRHQGTNVTYSQQSSGLTGIQYSLRIQRPNGVSGTNDQAVYYQFETADSYRFAGQTVTLSFWAKAGANFSPTNSVMASGIYSGTGTNQNITGGAYTGQVTVANQNNTLTTSWQRFSVSGSIGTTATQIAIIFGATPVGTAGANDWYEITGVQLELGSVATSFKRAGGGTLQSELAACQRYYQKAICSNHTLTGQAYTTSTGAVTIPLLQQMRSAPTITIPAAGSSTGQMAFLTSSGGYPATIGTNTAGSATVNYFRIEASGYTSAFTAGNATQLYVTGSNQTFFEASSEL